LKQNITGFAPFGDRFIASPGLSKVTGIEPDIDIYFLPLEFTGIKPGEIYTLITKRLPHSLLHPGFAELGASTPNFFSSIPLKARASSRGYVRLTSSFPQARLDINKLRFQDSGGAQDIADLRVAVKTMRKVMRGDPGVQGFIDEEVFPGEAVNTDAKLDQYVLENVYGEKHLPHCVRYNN
jgi:choline dehydrogenase-like flavoprotein